MNYQQILEIYYVFKLTNLLISNDHIQIVKIRDTFYIENSRKHLYVIQENKDNSYRDIKLLLDTFILFEENKMNPIDSYLKLRDKKYSMPKTIDYELLKTLQMQYITNKSYFNDNN
jgi:hypothetical protein